MPHRPHCSTCTQLPVTRCLASTAATNAALSLEAAADALGSCPTAAALLRGLTTSAPCCCFCCRCASTAATNKALSLPASAEAPLGDCSGEPVADGSALSTPLRDAGLLLLLPAAPAAAPATASDVLELRADNGPGASPACFAFCRCSTAAISAALSC